MRFITAVTLAAVIAVGCDPYAGQMEHEIVEGLVTAALGERKSRAEREYDDFGAVWLTQAGGPVMLVFGYSDDMLNCQIIRDAMVEASRPRRTDYACIPVR
jgi:hypothetical protein